MLPNDRTLKKAINRFQGLGFNKEFKLENKEMLCLQNKKRYQPQDMLILNSQRFEALSNPFDISALYAVKCHDGIKGLIIAAYGTYGDMKLIEFLDKVKIKRTRELLKISDN